jgi:deoxyguanosine kinase
MLKYSLCQKINLFYLRQLSIDYEQAVTNFEQMHPEIPVLRFNGDEMDFVKNEEHLTAMIEKLRVTLKETARET